MSSNDFFDEARISVISGKGGDGAVHFRREKFVPHGGPDGGDGGNGGSVILEADRSVNTLLSFRFKRRFAAQAGSPGSAGRRHGKQAPDVVAKVPVGTVVYDDESGDVVSDLSEPRTRATVVQGGVGGLGNSHFATSTRQAPEFAEKGQPGKERILRLELKLVADVGLVGLPNAGKSTLLSSISAARPKIGDYPFTTLSPNLGVVAVDDYSYVVADIPGLIEGSHAGHGLGDRFLRHIERTRVLVRVVDVSSPHPMRDFDQVTTELKEYDPALMERPQVVALTKLDLVSTTSKAGATARRLSKRGLETFTVSSVTHEGLHALVFRLAVILQELGVAEREREIDEGDFVYRARPDPDAFTVTRKRAVFTVQGETVERVVSMTDMDSADGVDRLQRQLKRLGVLHALEREGAREGSRVRIGDEELIWGGDGEEGLSTPGRQKAPGSRRRSRPETRASRGYRRD